jgi:hypothetical protein
MAAATVLAGTVSAAMPPMAAVAAMTLIVTLSPTWRRGSRLGSWRCRARWRPGALRWWRRGRCLWRRSGGVLRAAFDNLVQFASVEPDAAAFRAVVDLDALALGHHQVHVAARTGHAGLGHTNLGHANLGHPSRDAGGRIRCVVAHAETPSLIRAVTSTPVLDAASGQDRRDRGLYQSTTPHAPASSGPTAPSRTLDADTAARPAPLSAAASSESPPGTSPPATAPRAPRAAVRSGIPPKTPAPRRSRPAEGSPRPPARPPRRAPADRARRQRKIRGWSARRKTASHARNADTGIAKPLREPREAPQGPNYPRHQTLSG